MLMEKGYGKFTKGYSNILMNFLNAFEELPIVAHNVWHDRVQVLGPAFEKVGNASRLPKSDRWKCTVKMSDGIPGVSMRFLDDLLEHFGYERRDPEQAHDAVNDCRLTAKVYMDLMKISHLKKSHLGFIKE